MKTLELDLTPSGSLSIECVVNGPIETNSYFVGSAGKWVVVDPAWNGELLVEHFKQAHPSDELLVRFAPMDTPTMWVALPACARHSAGTPCTLFQPKMSRCLQKHR